MNAHPFQTARPAKNWRHRGFALVVTLSLMVLLTVIAVGLLSMSSVTMRKTNAEQPMAAARANAKLGLDLALDELQKAAGPDQRITAAADILTGGNTAKDGRKRWVGVWNTSTYNPATPDTKAFVRWLVSSSENTTSTPNTSNLTMVASDPAATDYEIFKAVDYPSGTNNATNSVKVPKVEISSNSSTSKHYYAYWVEDEGLKADLGWKEGNATTSELKQAARLSASPGVDYGVFGGPFTSSNVKYPITKESLTVNPWLANIDKALSPADMPLLMSSNSSLSNWLKSVRHDVTLGSLGVMADVKKGGLRRDLSLAFEMDGTAESPTTPKFNNQTEEFVGNGDALSTPSTITATSTPPRPKGLPVNERFLYRDQKSLNNPFSKDIIRDAAVMRGPNWWALRDYANLYKRLSGTSGDYTLQARAYFPNRNSESGNCYTNLFNNKSTWGEHWDSEQRTIWPTTTQVYVYHPARASYAPVNLGLALLVSVKDQGGKLAIALDPIMYLWNPYNRKLKFDSLTIGFGTMFPGYYKITNTTTGEVYEEALAQMFLRINAGAWGLNFKIQATDAGGSITMNPGEVIVATPSTAGSGKATPGYFNSGINTSGIIVTNLQKTKGPSGVAVNTTGSFTVNPTDSFTCVYDRITEWEGTFFYNDTNLPPDPASPTQALQTQHANMQMSPLGNVWPEQSVSVASPPSMPLTSSKQFFGLFMQLMKPALMGGVNPNPVEIFSRFNPAPLLIYKDLWRSCVLNQTCRNISAPGSNLLTDYGINFSGSDRNAFWGASYESATGSTSVPASTIPSSPLMSLVEFSHANLSLMASDPFHAVGNSWSHPLITSNSTYMRVNTGAGGLQATFTAADHSWLLNDALFDRYYLSGIAPAFSIGNGGYTADGTVTNTLTKFFSANYKSAQANPVMLPYLPPGGNSTSTITALSADDGYKKMGAFALIDGAFNVNSTSISAWTALLRASRDLKINYAQGGADNNSGSPFPPSNSPAAPGNGAASLWSGFSRLTDTQIANLATEIVKQVKLRGPFMSLSNFVNRRVGTPKTVENDMGALQAAIEAININSAIKAGAGGTTPDYTSSGAIYFMPGGSTAGNRRTTTNIPTDITQAKLLLPLAPRLSARSDTFRIRSYGEVRSADGSKVISYAMCEAIVQRVPEYFDSVTDAANNEPWDEGTTLNQTNKTFGRRFNVISFRWLTPNEI